MPRFQRRTTKEKRGRGKYFPRKKVCFFCADKTQVINYKDVALLSRYLSDRGRIGSRRKTGVCPKHQRSLSAALKRARYIALLPYTAEHIHQSGGHIPRERPRVNPEEQSN